ncbi:MAG TPA: MFS transporter [Kofleriaceae bacterium]|nr:MFS transporter [Kofleriaceae bacterium]
MRPARGIRRDMRLSFGDAAGYGAMVGTAETYLPAFGLALGMSAVSAGLIASVPLFAGGVLQLVAPRWIARVSSMRGWIAASTAIQALAFIPLIILALTHTTSTPLVFAVVSLYWAAGNCAAAGWMPWMARVVPQRLRGKFFGRRQGLVQATTLVGLIGAGVALHTFANQSGDGPMWIYAGMFGLAMISRLVSAICLLRMGRGVDPTPRRRTSLRSLPPKLWRTPRGTLIGYLVAMGAAAAVSGPFLTPYLLLQEHLDYAQYCAFTATIFVVKVVMLPVIGRLIPRVGLRRVLTISAIAIVPIPFMWLFANSFWWFIAMQAYAGVAWAGFDLGMLMALFDADDDSERISLQVMFSALQAIGTAGASLLGGFTLGMFGADHSAYLIVFMMSAAARIAATTMLVRGLPRLIFRLPQLVVLRAWFYVARRDRPSP